MGSICQENLIGLAGTSTLDKDEAAGYKAMVGERDHLCNLIPVSSQSSVVSRSL